MDAKYSGVFGKGAIDDVLDDFLEEKSLLIIDEEITFVPWAITITGTMAYLKHLNYFL